MRRSLALCCALAAAALVAVAGDSGGTGCPALFRGKDCTEPVLGLPSCLPGRDPYRFKFFSLTRRKFPQFLKTRWGRTMWMANRTVAQNTWRSMPETNFLGELEPPVKRCAVVSSSASLLGKGLGEEIDKHDLVMRLNAAPHARHENDVGTFTTLRLSSMQHSGFREDSTETGIVNWCPINTRRPHCLHKNLAQVAKQKMHGLYPGFASWVGRGLARNGRPHSASAGYMGALMLLHVCERVTVVGFNVEDAVGGTSAVAGRASGGVPSQSNVRRLYYTPRGGLASPEEWDGYKAGLAKRNRDYTFAKLRGRPSSYVKVDGMKDLGSINSIAENTLEDRLKVLRVKQRHNPDKDMDIIRVRKLLQARRPTAARRGGASNNGRRPYALGALYEKACLWELKEAGVLRTLGDDAPVQAAADREQL
eukprot:jgi/Tetstr1/463637/TSEL_008498.t1